MIYYIILIVIFVPLVLVAVAGALAPVAALVVLAVQRGTAWWEWRHNR